MKIARDAPALLLLCGDQPPAQGPLNKAGSLALFHQGCKQQEKSRSEQQEQ